MGTPGVQITEILKVIESSIKFVIKLKEAPDEIRSILDSVEHAIDLLKALEQRRNTYGDEIETAHLTESAIERYKAVIAKLEKFIKDHSRLTEGQFRGRLYWVVNEHFRNEKKSLERDLQKVEDRIGLAINMYVGPRTRLLDRPDGCCVIGIPQRSYTVWKGVIALSIRTANAFIMHLCDNHWSLE